MIGWFIILFFVWPFLAHFMILVLTGIKGAALHDRSIFYIQKDLIWSVLLWIIFFVQLNFFGPFGGVSPKEFFKELYPGLPILILLGMIWIYIGTFVNFLKNKSFKKVS